MTSRRTDWCEHAQNFLRDMCRICELRFVVTKADLFSEFLFLQVFGRLSLGPSSDVDDIFLDMMGVAYLKNV